jgi:Bacterial Ig domain
MERTSTLQPITSDRDDRSAYRNFGFFCQALFMGNDVGIARVDFSVDGKLYHSENMAPWDFNGTAATGGTALPFNPASWANGTHAISATATMTGGSHQTANATISVGSSVAASGILLSYAPDRSNAVDLNGRTVSGNIYVFVPSSGVNQVRFLIDGTQVKIESIAPFDLAGTSTNGTNALAFDASALAAGTHTVQAQMTLSNGSPKTATATIYH